MDVNDRRQMEEKVEAFAARARRIFLHCDNEEQTKISLINPYLELLGYDVRDPVICRLEFSADIGKTGEKVDYAILQDGTPSILIEAKAATLDLRAYSVPTQLQRYFMATRANFAVLTNGLLWHWYRSTAGNNMLETTPFLVHDVRTPGKLERNWLMSISGPAYDSSRALAQAEGEGMNSAFLGWIEEARRQPSDEFLRMLIKSTKLGIATASRIKRARESFVSTFGYYIDRETDSLFEAARGHRQEVETQEKIEKEQRDHSEHEVAAPETLQPDGVEQSLDLGDGGTPITAGGLQRAWRVRGGPWQRAKSGKDMQIAICRYLASQDIRGKSRFYSETQTRRGRPFFPTSDAIDEKHSYLYSLVEPSLDRWTVTHLSGRNQREFIEQLCELVQSRDSHPIRLGGEVEIWLPIRQPRKIRD